MINLYIKITTGALKWLYFIILNLLGPFVRVICILLVVGGGLTFLLMLLAGIGRTGFDAATAGLSVRHVMFIGLGMALAGMSGAIFYELKIDRMFIERLYPDEETEDYGISRLVWLRNWIGVLALLVGFSFAARYHYPSLYVFEWPVIGFAWFIAVGVVLGVGQWLYRRSDFLVDFVAQIGEEGRGKMRSPQKHADRSRIVVPFKRAD